ncbi:hypothetical protein BJ875DRAFT_472408 [Amylocarpus encephaloides]|uniref:SMODS and SLOG-associating 2TM effector domain-containing protein n=1 Tax=Amylocarpus encephaloides TaxID=45428 RepID=A0A9P7YB10_9HELO|nr:hypothetical protein BJ875DRAFT_472408 [Amylocarpus encephaloides]
MAFLDRDPNSVPSLPSSRVSGSMMAAGPNEQTPLLGDIQGGNQGDNQGDNQMSTSHAEDPSEASKAPLATSTNSPRATTIPFNVAPTLAGERHGFSDARIRLHSPSKLSVMSEVSEAPKSDVGEDSAANLKRFREAVGIHRNFGENDDLESCHNQAQGLYKKIIRIQRKRTTQYQLVNTLYYSTIAAQVLISAVLAALGPSAKYHTTAITALGALNAALAGLIAMLKGQGLPDRLRRDRYQMRLVQDFIEETDVRLAISSDPVTQVEVEQLVGQIFDKYHTARDTAKINHPDSFARPQARRGQADETSAAAGEGTRSERAKAYLRGKKKAAFG